MCSAHSILDCKTVRIFCVFKYARAVKQKWEKNRLFCSLIQFCLDCFSLVSFLCLKPAPRGHETGDRSVRNTNKHQNTLLVHLSPSSYPHWILQYFLCYRVCLPSTRGLPPQANKTVTESAFWKNLQGQIFFQRPGWRSLSLLTLDKKV